MSIIFVALKILGILILIPVALLLILLLCPICYQAEGEFDGNKLRGKLRFSWALVIVRGRLLYNDEMEFGIHVFGIPMYRSDSRRWSLFGSEEKETSLEQRSEKEGVKSKPPKEKKKDPNTEAVSDKERDTEDVFDLVWEGEEKKAKKETPQKLEKPVKDQKKIVDFFQKCYNKLKSIPKKIQEFTEKMEAVGEAFGDEKIQNAVVRIKTYGFDGIRLLLPQKIKGHLVFGTDDPALTGKILGLIAAIMPASARYFEITPDFSREILEGKVLVRGRIRRYRLLMLLWKIFRDKDLLKQKDRVITMLGG